MKHCISVKLLSIFRVSRPPAETQSTPIENFLATVLVEISETFLLHSIRYRLFHAYAASKNISAAVIGDFLPRESTENSHHLCVR